MTGRLALDTAIVTAIGAAAFLGAAIGAALIVLWWVHR